MARRFAPYLVAVAAAASVLPAATLPAQGYAGDLYGIPPAYYPPPNTCRIWLDGVHPNRQPQPMDCSLARRNLRPNSRIIYGVTAERATQSTSQGDVIGGAGGAAGGVDRRAPGMGTVDRRAPDCDWADNDRRQGNCTPSGADRRESATATPNTVCDDGNRDGWCDDMWLRVPHPQTMPGMRSVLQAGQRPRPTDLRLWIGDDVVDMLPTDADANGIPERVVWRDRRGQVIQVWLDDNRDGLVDRVGVYRNGAVATVFAR
ncbi:MAG: hypothetical protein WKG32_02715 [Gemmatimonadaceae bacterium]